MPVPVLKDSDDWRGALARLSDLEKRLGITDSKVDKLVERQELQHEENKRELEGQKRSLERIGKMLVGEKGDNGLVGTVSALRADVVGVKDSVDDIKDTFRHLPKTILTILLIFTALIGLLSFFGPSIRKAMGMTATSQRETLGVEVRPLSTSIPATISTHNGGK